MDMDGYLRSESEERIANRGAMNGFQSRNSQSGDNTIEMVDVEKGAYTTTIAAGLEEEDWNRNRKTRFEGDKDRIVKTVQMHQYSS